jgi:hypothetical protein
MTSAATKHDLAAAVSEIRATLRNAGAAGGSEASDPHISAELLEQLIEEESLRRYLRRMYPSVRHCGPREIMSLVRDLREVGYTDIRSLHRLMIHTAEAFSDVVQQQREAGEDMDKWTDSFPVRLFLPVLDEHYCRIHFPNVHARRQREHWVRPERPSPEV